MFHRPVAACEITLSEFNCLDAWHIKKVLFFILDAYAGSEAATSLGVLEQLQYCEFRLSVNNVKSETVLPLIHKLKMGKWTKCIR